MQHVKGDPKNSDNEFPRLLTPREAAAIRRTTTGHLANERAKGKGSPWVRLGGRVYYPEDQLAEHIRARIVTPTPRPQGQTG